MYQLTIEQSFDAAHFLAEYRGKCGNIHGHRWRVLLEIETEALQENDQERGMCVDFSVLKEELKKIVDRLDHNFLIDLLAERGHPVSMVKVYETPNNCAAYRV